MSVERSIVCAGALAPGDFVVRQSMKGISRIAVVVLVAAFFATGYVAREGVDARQDTTATLKNRPVLSLPIGTRVASADLGGVGNVDLRPLETLLSVVDNLRTHYVEQITAKDEGNMTHHALKAMLRSLDDPNTRFLEPAQRRIVADAMEGKFHGIGASLGIKRVKDGKFAEEHLIVIAPLPGSPAELAGLKSGDDILAVDGKTVLPFDSYRRLNERVEELRRQKADKERFEAERERFEAEKKRVENGIGVVDAEQLLTSQDKKVLELTILSKGAAKEVKIKVQPREFTLDPVTSAVTSGDYGYLRINCFCARTPDDFAEAMRHLQSKQLKGLVLDLRNVTGGQIESALEVAKWFAPGKTMATLVRSRNRKSPVKIPAFAKEDTWNKPVVVLVNRGTARTPEVLASALKENGVARLVGEKTYGDFIETTLIDQRDGSAVMMTTGKYLTSKGGDYLKVGLPVDVPVAHAGSGDPQLNEAVKLLSSAGSRS